MDFSNKCTPSSRHFSPSVYVLRCTIVLTMIAAVAAILHLSHYNPKQTFLSCDRPCHHLDWPMICRVKLTLEVYQSLSKSCGNCPANETACLGKHCVSVDGQRRGVLVANRQMPGPSIQVCENDILVVDVVNRLPGRAVAVHWRGQSQIETPCMDGAPLVTQCPIPSYTVFQYKFRAAAAGTHLWHAHAGGDVADGLSGSLIVRQADAREPHRTLYDVDDPKHVILISEWKHFFSTDATSNPLRSKTAALLVNGRGRQSTGPRVPLSTFTLIPGRRHRFRVAHAGGAGSCPVNLALEGHSILVIALDGHPVSPLKVKSVTLVKGERLDFVLNASGSIRSYGLTVRTMEGCLSPAVVGGAILRYKGFTDEEPSMIPSLGSTGSPEGDQRDTKVDVALTSNPFEGCNDRDKICLTEIQSKRKLPKVLEGTPDVTMHLPINYSIETSDFADGGEIQTRVLHVSNVTFTFPSSPLLTQGQDVPQEIICSGNAGDGLQVTTRCRRDDISEGQVCECVHVRRIPAGATVEIILIDQGGLDDLVYHLHGSSFYVVGAKHFGRSVSVEEVKEMDNRGMLMVRNLNHPPLKDTVVVPKYGLVALRFKADNRGYWMLRDEHASQWTRGLDVVLQVGEPDGMIQAPEDFPKCGSFVGPDYFLI
ncbi:laccase-2 isoform X1 [Neodiprion lecontei]|uniref:Laccase-2 isoform X1 n=1 Tax=Neodiprion lecontei TaxID=441921 RepID=A0ABM3GCP6_NEOLC|nr:laccase-2 isoform X1 [Neodiprion lecontei]